MNKMPSVPGEKNEKKSFKGRKEKDRIFLNLLLSFLIHILSLIHFATLQITQINEIIFQIYNNATEKCNVSWKSFSYDPAQKMKRNYSRTVNCPVLINSLMHVYMNDNINT